MSALAPALEECSRSLPGSKCQRNLQVHYRPIRRRKESKLVIPFEHRDNKSCRFPRSCSGHAYYVLACQSQGQSASLDGRRQLEAFPLDTSNDHWTQAQCLCTTITAVKVLPSTENNAHKASLHGHVLRRTTYRSFRVSTFSSYL